MWYDVGVTVAVVGDEAYEVIAGEVGTGNGCVEVGRGRADDGTTTIT